MGDDTFTATYSYLANSPLASTLTFKQSGATKMTTSKQHDKLNRLLGISSASSVSSLQPLAFGYSYNAANQRTRANLADGSAWGYQYDALGQVASGKRYWSDGIPVAGQQFEYGFDDIGNRASTKAGGDQGGANLRPATYTVNSLNQYTQRTVPNGVDILGIANTGAGVSVNADTNVYRRGEYFRKELGLTNSSAAQFPLIVVASTLGTNTASATGRVFLAKSPEAFYYDLDGNLLSDGRWTNKWDAENRLIEMVGLTNAPTDSKRWLKFDYDHQGRRILKTAYVWTNSAWVIVLSNKFLYDGWNLVAELNATNNNVIRSYAWGLDLSGSEQGASGVGGLLVVRQLGGGRRLPAYDGNGNVMGLYDPGATNWVARYEYGPFGETIRASGTAAAANPFRFSTKYTDDETDLLYYGYRYYSPGTGRWLSRDRIDENGGVNLYAFFRHRFENE